MKAGKRGHRASIAWAAASQEEEWPLLTGGKPGAEEPDDTDDGQEDDDDVNLVRIFLHNGPVFTQAHAAVEEKAVPQGGANESHQQKGQKRHPAHTGGDGDEMADHRDEAGRKDGEYPLPLVEIPLGDFEVVPVEEEILADLEHQGLTAVIAHSVGGQRTDERAEAGGQQGEPQVPFAVGDQKTDKGHDCLARYRCNHAFQGHKDKSARIGGGVEDLNGGAADNFSDHTI